MSDDRIYQIAQRANINHYNTTDGEVVIYEDHRTIINVLFHLHNERTLSEPVDLIMFDNHDDFCNVNEAVLEKVDGFLKSPSKEELNQIVEFDLNPLDDDWVTFGMELGLIGNVFLFNSDECNVNFRKEYKTRNFGNRYLYNLRNVWSALGHRGYLGDKIKSEYQPLWDDFGWVVEDGKFHHRPKRKFIFDIDLDCFSTRILDKTIAIPQEILIPLLCEFRNPAYHYYNTSQQFIKDLIKRSEITTICYENGCCGGIREAHKIFNLVDELFFEYELGE